MIYRFRLNHNLVCILILNVGFFPFKRFKLCVGGGGGGAGADVDLWMCVFLCVFFF